VLVAGVAGFKRGVRPVNPSAQFLRRWIERDTFLWLTSEDILAEYRDVLRRLRVRPHLIGRIVNLLSEEAEYVSTRRSAIASPDPGDAPFWDCAITGRADFLITLNPRHFPQGRLPAKVIGPSDSIPARPQKR
jgi:predicted nucleic acid-binding protein